MIKYFIGVDEAGRGPLAGPVAVGAVLTKKDFEWDLIQGVNDSKKLSEKNREAIFLRSSELKKEGKLDFAVSMVSAKVIDKIGIVPAINLAITRSLLRIEKNYSSHRSDLLECAKVKLDGGLRAPKEFLYQETIIKGDQKEKVIGLASIMAKVTRDRYMVRKSLSPSLACYGFDIHKGYGTEKHRKYVEKYGLSALHRKSFCKNFSYKK